MAPQRTRKDVALEYNEMAVRFLGQEVNDVERRIFIHETRDLDPTSLVNALAYFRHKPDQRFMPRASQVRDVLQNEGTFEQRAARIVGSIFAGISRWGYCNSKKAKEGLGELAYQCVKETVGSWTQFCESTPQDLSKQSTLRAQMRNWLVSEMERQARAELHTGKYAVLIDSTRAAKQLNPSKQDTHNHEQVIGTTITGLAAQLDANKPRGDAPVHGGRYEPRCLPRASVTEQLDD